MIIHHTVTIYQDNPKIVSAGLPEISLHSFLEQQWGLSRTTGDPRTRASCPPVAINDSLVNLQIGLIRPE